MHKALLSSIDTKYVLNDLCSQWQTQSQMSSLLAAPFHQHDQAGTTSVNRQDSSSNLVSPPLGFDQIASFVDTVSTVVDKSHIFCIQSRQGLQEAINFGISVGPMLGWARQQGQPSARSSTTAGFLFKGSYCDTLPNIETCSHNAFLSWI
jgi:hypothetical protein